MPPYGQEEVEEIESIFELSHLRSKALFLDIQCKYLFLKYIFSSDIGEFYLPFYNLDRMPSQIGNFISDAIYEGQLRSNPGHPQRDNSCAFFVHVPDSHEEPFGTSYCVCYFLIICQYILTSLLHQNPSEIKTILKMATQLQEDDESFKIITPYVGQKTSLENALKDAGLPYQNKCFAVDSFQGLFQYFVCLFSD